ncbi:MAG TPA: MarR family transcriptional regulator, partial [Deinococcales bacterium]|nr:MarR family transcriptional regulator [Deinococcales bacterium]
MNPRAVLGDEGYRALAEFRCALRRYEAASEAIARQEGLPARQLAALMALAGHPNRTMAVGDLAKELVLTHNATVELTQRAEAAGLLRRRPDPNRGRHVLLTLSTKGAALLERAASRHVLELSEPRQDLVDSLAHWCAALDREAAAVAPDADGPSP